MVRINRRQTRLRLVINNSLPDRRSSDPPATRCRNIKIGSKLFDMTDPGIFDLAPSDLLDCSLRDSTASGHFAPAPFRGLEVRQNGLVEGTHVADSSPDFGFTQPSNGVKLSLRCLRMGRPRVPAAATSPIVSTFIENVEALLPVSFPAVETETDRIEALAKRAGVGRETIRRAMRGGASCRLDIVAKIASALGVTTPQLLTQGFGTMRAAEQRASARQEPIPTRRTSQGA